MGWKAVPCAYVGIVLCTTSTVLLSLVTLSAPVFRGIYFLEIQPRGGERIRYGCFGRTGLKTLGLGYHFVQFQSASNNTGNASPDAVYHWDVVTQALILHAVGACITLSAAISGIWGVRRGRMGGFWMIILSVVAEIPIATALVTDMTLFIPVRDYYVERGILVKSGNAQWMTCAAFVVTLIGIFTSCCGTYGLFFRDIQAWIDQKALPVSEV